MSHALPYLKWLAELKAGDTVHAYTGSEFKGVGTIEAANDKWVTVGKYGKAKRYNRKDGIICGHPPLKHLFRIEPPRENAA